MLAIDRVVFTGQPVAAVAADEPAIAEEALDLIDVEYEVLPAAVDPLRSMQPGAPPVADAGTEADTSEALAHGSVAGVTTETRPARAVNVSQQARLQRGDVAAAFAASGVVIERTYRVPMVHQNYLEPHAVLAQWDATGVLTLWASTQGSFNTRSEVADVLEIPENRVRVIPVECGGGFGGKIRALCEPITALLARATGRPVLTVLSREESMRMHPKRHPITLHYEVGCDEQGKLVAVRARMVGDKGAYASVGAKVLERAAGPGPFERVVDLGTGSGRMLTLLGKKARMSIGLDLSHNMLNIARSNVARAGLDRVELRHGDIFSTRLPAESADLVLVHQVLHYLSDPGAAVKEAARIVEPGGRLIIADFAPHKLEFLREQHQHRRLGFAEPEMARWLAEAGLGKVRSVALPATRADGLTVKIWTAERAGEKQRSAA